MATDFIKPSADPCCCTIMMESNAYWMPVAQWFGPSVPSKGDIIFLEDVNGPLEIVRIVWGVKDGHPLTCDIHVQGSSFPVKDVEKG